MASSYGKLWTAGYSWRDVINRPPAADAIEAPKGKGKGSRKQLPQPQAPASEDATTGDYGKFAGQMRQIQSDRQAIMQMVQRLPDSEKKMLPEIVPTVDSLMNRAVELGRTLNQMEGEVDSNALHKVDVQLKDLEAEGPGPESERHLELLTRQRKTLADLMERREKVIELLERVGLIPCAQRAGAPCWTTSRW